MAFQGMILKLEDGTRKVRRQQARPGCTLASTCAAGMIVGGRWPQFRHLCAHSAILTRRLLAFIGILQVVFPYCGHVYEVYVSPRRVWWPEEDDEQGDTLEAEARTVLQCLTCKRGCGRQEYHKAGISFPSARHALPRIVAQVRAQMQCLPCVVLPTPVCSACSS